MLKENGTKFILVPIIIIKLQIHHPWRRPVMAESLGRALTSSLSYDKTSFYIINNSTHAVCLGKGGVINI